MAELILYAQLGIVLNVLAFFIHTIATLLSAIKLGLMKTFEISQISLKIYREYNEIMSKHHKVMLFMEKFAIAIPFYAFWLFLNIWFRPIKDCSYFELPTVLKQIELKRLRKEHHHNF